MKDPGMIKLYHTLAGPVAEIDGRRRRVRSDWGSLLASDSLADALAARRESHPEDGPAVIDEASLLPPIGRQEVWAAGVTYLRSKTARMEESKDAGGGSFYDRVYDAPRPELFFKATPHRVVGPGQAVKIRRDSKWNVPEPELALLLSPAGRIVGYTVGNDMSSRDIEGENPLYLPQAKVYDGCCALGPCILVTDEPLPKQTQIRLDIRRGGGSVFSGSTSLGQIKRSFQELIDYLFRDNSFPDGCFLLTGTGVVPPDTFTLQPGDEVGISIEPIGTLRNTVALTR